MSDQCHHFYGEPSSRMRCALDLDHDGPHQFGPPPPSVVDARAAWTLFAAAIVGAAASASGESGPISTARGTGIYADAMLVEWRKRWATTTGER